MTEVEHHPVASPARKVTISYSIIEQHLLQKDSTLLHLSKPFSCQKTDIESIPPALFQLMSKYLNEQEHQKM